MLCAMRFCFIGITKIENIMKKYIEPITAIEKALTVESFLTDVSAGGEPIGPVGPGGGGGDAKERDEFDEFVEYMENQDNTTKSTLW